MAVVRNAPTRVADGGGMGMGSRGELSSAAMQAALAHARRDLQLMREGGLGGGFVPGAAPSERRSLEQGMTRLEHCDRQIALLIVQIAESRACNAAIATATSPVPATVALQNELKSIVSQADVLRSIVQRQQTIKGLWTTPTPAFTRKSSEVRELEKNVTLLLS